MTCLVSIIVPAFNAEAFLRRAVESALAQTHRDVEVIIVDDGSTDGTARVMRELAADARVVTVGLPENRGVSAARNAGLRRARGEWVALLDADDAYAPERVAALLAAADGLDMVADNLAMRNFASGAALGAAFPAEWMEARQDMTLRYLLARDVPGIFRREMAYMKPLMRREFLSAHGIVYREDVGAAEDLLFYADCLRAGARLRMVAASFYIYSVRAGSISSRGDANEGSKRANLILLAECGRQDAVVRALLTLRLAAVNFELVIWYGRTRQWRRLAGVMAEMDKGFLAAKLAAAVLKRVGIRGWNPAAGRLFGIMGRA